MSDNGPQYVSRKFHNFSSDWDFKHTTSSPHYPQSNGFIERQIQTVKKTLKKAKKSDSDPYLAMLVLNSSPNSSGMSPASIMYNRNPRTRLPSAIPNRKHYSKSKVDNDEYRNKIKDLTHIKPNTVVRIRTDREKDWKQTGKVLQKSSEPRSYLVLNEKGNIVRRNRKHLIPTNDEFRIDIDNEVMQENQLQSTTSLVEPSSQIVEPSQVTYLRVHIILIPQHMKLKSHQ